MKAYFNNLVLIDDQLQSPLVRVTDPSNTLAEEVGEGQGDVMSYFYAAALKRQKETQILRMDDDSSSKLVVQAVLVSLPEVKTLVELVLSSESLFIDNELGYLPQLAHSINKKIDTDLWQRTTREIKYILVIKENVSETTENQTSMHQSHPVLAKTEFKQRKVLSRVKEAVRSLLFGVDSFASLFESKEKSALDQIVDFVLKFCYLYESRKAQIQEKIPLRMLAQYLRTHLSQLPEDYKAYNYRKLYYELVAEFKPKQPSQVSQSLLICE